MSEYKLVPVEPTDEMVSAAEDAYMPFGDMEMAIRMAVLAAPAVQGEPVGEVRFELGAPSSIFAELYSKSLPVLAPGTKLYAAPQPAEQQPCPEDIREGAPYDDPAFESLCREHEIWGTAAAAQCAVFWEAGKRVAEQQPAPHPDDAAVDRFAAAMKAKLAKKCSEGRTVWQEGNSVYLSELLREHVEKGDPVDVGNLAMMIHENGFSIEKKPVRWATVSGCAEQTPDVSALVGALTMARETIASALRANAPDYFTTDADIARHVVIQRIDAALAAHRKQGGEV